MTREQLEEFLKLTLFIDNYGYLSREKKEDNQPIKFQGSYHYVAYSKCYSFEIDKDSEYKRMSKIPVSIEEIKKVLES